MRIAYFDCSSGISGDMILGSLVDAGVEVDFLNSLIDGLHLSGCRLNSRKVKKGGIVATKVDVTFPREERKTPCEFLSLIEEIDLPPHLKEKCREVFFTIAKAEAKVHQESIENLHFHELGSLDTLIDVVCSVAGIDVLKVEKVYASAVNLGGGTVNTSHGILPVPAPATLEILKNVPVYSSTSSFELTTPTGAAILKVFSSDYGNIPLMRVEKVGYGAGEKELSFPNVLRILIGEMESSLEEDEVSVIETNIDDMNPQFYGHVAELLFEKGALDVFLTPVYMKKNRPGVVLTVICEKKDEARFLEVIFRETTTLGVRVYHAGRRKLKRETRIIKTSLGEVKVKLGILNGKIVNFSPEYEDCKKIASSRSLSLKEVYQILRKELSF